MAEFIYTMKKVRKAHGDKVILDDVTIMFYPGAKIGVVGPNGAGKSSVLKIMAGLDTPGNGEAYLSPGYTVGILQQEPPLTEAETPGHSFRCWYPVGTPEGEEALARNLEKGIAAPAAMAGSAPGSDTDGG